MIIITIKKYLKEITIIIPIITLLKTQR